MPTCMQSNYSFHSQNLPNINTWLNLTTKGQISNLQHCRPPPPCPLPPASMFQHMPEIIGTAYGFPRSNIAFAILESVQFIFFYYPLIQFFKYVFHWSKHASQEYFSKTKKLQKHLKKKGFKICSCFYVMFFIKHIYVAVRAPCGKCWCSKHVFWRLTCIKAVYLSLIWHCSGK